MLPVSAPLPARGQTVDEKRVEAARLADQLEAQGTQVSMAAERFNRAQLALAEVQESMARAEADMARSSERMAGVKARLADVAVMAYVSGGHTATLSRLARSTDHVDLAVRRQYMQVTAADQRTVLGELRAAREDLAERTARLAAEEREAKEAAGEADDRRRQAMAAEEAQRALLVRAQGELADLVAAEEARRAAEEAARRPAPTQMAAPPAAAAPAAAAPAAETPAAGSPQVAAAAPSGGTVPPSSKAAIAVATAEAQIGKPYVWGGSGPDSFDCSGLTAYAWRAAGVHLSHSAYTQWFETTRVPIDQIQPGDLLFFGKDGVESIHHNAIYVGGGQMVEASQTGVPIRYRGWRSIDLVGAGRPG
ncbi:MAG: C40 family peptidase [Actinomycetota bacterium]